MNGQENENQSIRPDFNKPMAGDGPAPVTLNSQGTGFNGRPGQSEWSPNIAPAAGPMDSAATPSVTPSNIGQSAPEAPTMSSLSTPAPTPVTPAPMTGGLGSPSVASSVSGMPEAPKMPTPSPMNQGMSVSSVPPPPSNGEYQVKTMKSDMDTLKASGGAETVPKTFTPAPMGEPIFNPAAAAPVKKTGGNKTLLILIISVIVLGVAAVGFFLVKPILFAPTPTTPEPLPPVIIPEEGVLPPSELPEVSETSGLTPIVHNSFFSTPADNIESYTVETVTRDAVKILFAAPEGGALGDGSMRELTISSASGPISSSAFMGAFFPDMNIEALASAFEDDFTTFVYRDGSSDLPGFIAKVSSSAAAETLSSMSAAIESSANLGNIYLVDPGKISTFKDGAVSGNPVRYASFATAGYAFNYGWLKDDAGADYLMVSSSYQGMTEAVSRAGF